MGYNITLEPEQVDAIIIGELKESIDSLENDLVSIADHRDGYYLGIFDSDPNIDADRIVQHIEAMKLILSFYAGELTTF